MNKYIIELNCSEWEHLILNFCSDRKSLSSGGLRQTFLSGFHDYLSEKLQAQGYILILEIKIFTHLK